MLVKIVIENGELFVKLEGNRDTVIKELEVVISEAQKHMATQILISKDIIHTKNFRRY